MPASHSVLPFRSKLAKPSGHAWAAWQKLPYNPRWCCKAVDRVWPWSNLCFKSVSWKKGIFWGHGSIFFLLLTYFCENLTRNKPLQHHCYTVLIQERAALCSFTEPENSPKVIAIWGLYPALEQLRHWESIQAFLNLWVKIGTWMTSFIRSQLNEGPLGPKERERLRGAGRESFGAKKKTERNVYGLRLFLP